jgi:hypothetical protein
MLGPSNLYAGHPNPPPDMDFKAAIFYASYMQAQEACILNLILCQYDYRIKPFLKKYTPNKPLYLALIGAYPETPVFHRD